MRIRRSFLIVMGLVLTLCEGRSWAQPPDDYAVFIVNPKGCLDPSPEAMAADSCPPGTPSPWTSCPAGECAISYDSELCSIPSAPNNIHFTRWDEYTNASVFNPPQVGPGRPGLGAVEVSRRLCSRIGSCPCRRRLSGARACIRDIYTEDWLIQYATNPRLACITDGGGGGGSIGE